MNQMGAVEAMAIVDWQSGPGLVRMVFEEAVEKERKEGSWLDWISCRESVLLARSIILSFSLSKIVTFVIDP